jgi:hypothetical protein
MSNPRAKVGDRNIEDKANEMATSHPSELS